MMNKRIVDSICIKPLSIKVMLLISCLAVTCVSAFAGITDNTRPEIFLEYSSEKAPVDKTRVLILLDGNDVTPEAQIESWRVSHTPAQPLAEGVHNVHVIVYDAEGNRGEKAWSFTIDSAFKAAQKPEISFVAPTPSNGEIIKDKRPVVISVKTKAASADAISADSLKLKLMPLDGGQQKAGAAIFERGVYTANFGELESGRYALSAKVEDAQGNVSGEAILSFTVDVSAPVIKSFSVVPDSLLPDGEAAIAIDVEDVPAGNAQICVVKVKKDGTPVYEKQARVNSGKNAIRIKASEIESVPAGAYSFTAVCIDAAGNESAPSDAKQITVVSGSGPVLIAAPIDTRRKGIVFMDKLPSITSTPEIDVAGYAPADADVSIMINGAPSAQTAAESSGRFSVNSLRLLEGENFISAAALNSAGELESQTDEFPVLLDTQPPRISIASPIAGQVLEPGEVEILFTIDDYMGSGVDERRIALRIDGKDYSRQINGSNGNYYCDMSQALSAGHHEARLESVDKAGNGAITQVIFVVAEAIAQPPADDDFPPQFPDIDSQPPVVDTSGAAPPASDTPQPQTDGGDTVQPEPAANEDMPAHDEGASADNPPHDDNGGEGNGAGNNGDNTVEDESETAGGNNPPDRCHSHNLMKCSITIQSARDGMETRNDHINIEGKITFSGISIALCVNGNCGITATSGNGGHFGFQHVELFPGENIIAVSAEIDGVVYEETITITYRAEHETK